MTTTRGGKVLENRIEYYGRHAHRHSTLPGQRRKKSSVAKNTRSQQSSLPPPPQYVPPPRPAPKIIVPRLLRRSTSDEKPYCSAYGCSRYDLFPTYHFCSPCKLFDEDLLFPHLTNVIKRTSFVYKCTADHTSWACPTQTSDKYLTTKVNKGNVNCKPPSKCRRKYVINEESEADDASTLTEPED